MSRLGRFFWSVSALSLLSVLPLSALSIGSVQARRCVEQSKAGKAEKDRFEQLRRQLELGVEGKEKEMNDLRPKLSDEYLDTLTPEAERQLREKVQQLQTEHQELYYNMSMTLNKADYDMMQKLLTMIQAASKTVALSKKMDLVLNDEACFYRSEALDLTADVIQQLDLMFDADSAVKK